MNTDIFHPVENNNKTETVENKSDTVTRANS